MIPDLTLRSGTLRDMPELQKLYVDTIEAVCKKDYDIRQINVWTSGISDNERWTGILRDQVVIVAQTGGKIVGFCSLDGGKHIDMFYVHKDFLGRGVASAMYLAIEEEAIRTGQSQLTSDVSITARPFFERVGFIVFAEQTVLLKGVEFSNFKMIRELPS